MSALGDSVVGPLFVAAAAIAVGGLRAGRRRSALNEALHEVRRPLQALSLAGGAELHGSVRLAAAALERLDSEINGTISPFRRRRVDVHALVGEAVRRWQARAHAGEASLSLRDEARAAVVEGDPAALGQAIDNLVVNAIEHGGRRIVVEARSTPRWLRIAVLDSGRGTGAPRSAGRLDAAASRFGGGRRRGHGLRVVRGIVDAHAGRFSLRTRPQGSAAVIELPLRSRDDDRAA